MSSVYLGLDARMRVEGRAFNNVKDVTLNMSSATADITARNNSGWRSSVRTLRECSLSFQIVLTHVTGEGYDEDGESDARRIVNSFLASSGSSQFIGAAVMDSEHGEGICGEWSVTSCNRNENLEDAVTYDVELSLVKFYGWFQRNTNPISWAKTSELSRVFAIFGTSYFQ